jgi:hypothetical protein
MTFTPALTRKDNATYLFQRPFQNARSEQYWSTLLAMFLVHLGRRESPSPIPTWHLEHEPPHWAYREYRRFDPSRITWDGVFVEPSPRDLLRYICAGRLRPTEEQILANHLGAARGVGPDLVVFRPEGTPQVALIEVIAAGVRLAPDIIKRYRDAERMLSDQLDLTATFMIVCSVGHDARTSGIDEREISRTHLELMLWDQLLDMMGRDKEFACFLPPDVLAYTKAPLECACPRPGGGRSGQSKEPDGADLARTRDAS